MWLEQSTYNWQGISGAQTMPLSLSLAFGILHIPSSLFRSCVNTVLEKFSPLLLIPVLFLFPLRKYSREAFRHFYNWPGNSKDAAWR